MTGYPRCIVGLTSAWTRVGVSFAANDLGCSAVLGVFCQFGHD